MRGVGLISSDTGQPGGKETGQKMSHVIEPGGYFEQACTAYLAAGAAILYHDRAGDGEDAGTRRKKAASKTRYTCPSCGLNAWAKPDARLRAVIVTKAWRPISPTPRAIDDLS